MSSGSAAKSSAQSAASGFLLAALAPLGWLLPQLAGYATPFVTDAEARLRPFDFGLHPLARGVLALCSLLPLGPLPMRPQLAAVLALAAVCVALCATLDGALRAAGVRDVQLRVSLAIGVTWAACGTALLELKRLDGFAEHGPSIALALACTAQRLRLLADPRREAARRYARLAASMLVLLAEQPWLAVLTGLMMGATPWRTGLAVLRTTFAPVQGAASTSMPPAASVPPPAPVRSVARASIALLALGLGAACVHLGAARMAPSRSAAPDVLADMLWRSAPNRALLLAPERVTRAMHAVRREDGSRPDLLVLPLETLSDPNLAEARAHAHPELTGLIRAALLQDALDATELQSLATQRPVRVHPALHALAPLHEVLTPASWAAEVSSSVVISGDLRDAAASTLRTRLDERRFDELVTAELDADTRDALREHYVIHAALVAPLARGSLLTESVQRALALVRSERDRSELARALLAVGLPPGVIEPMR